MQSLTSDSHQHSNPHPSEALDLSHLNLNLGDIHHPPDVNHVGGLDGVDVSHHSLMAPAGALDAAYRESLAEIKTDFSLESHPHDLVSHSTILHPDHNHYQENFSAEHHSENAVDFSAKSAYTNS